MPQPKKGPRLGSGPKHQRLMLSNLALVAVRARADPDDRGQGEDAAALRRASDHEGQEGRRPQPPSGALRDRGPRRGAQAVRRHRPSLRRPQRRLHPDPEARSPQRGRRADGSHRARRGRTSSLTSKRATEISAAPQATRSSERIEACRRTSRFGPGQPRRPPRAAAVEDVPEAARRGELEEETPEAVADETTEADEEAAEAATDEAEQADESGVGPETSENEPKGDGS